jgi:nicotinamide-nucleotide amidase
MLPDLIRRGRKPTVGITVSKATISLRIMAEGATLDECNQQIAETESIIQESLGDLVFGRGEDELQHAVIALCSAQQTTLATGEVGADGLLTHWLSEADKNRKVFMGGCISRQRPARTPEQTVELAQEVRKVLRADLGLAISDFPHGDSGVAPAPEFHVAVAGPHGRATASYPFTGHPEILQPRAVKQALNFLRLLLAKHDPRILSSAREVL